MTDPARAQTVDTDIAKHCAYSLPGVALTLGRRNWHCLKDTYETLASDVQVKQEPVRRHTRNWRGGAGGGGRLLESEGKGPRACRPVSHVGAIWHAYQAFTR